MSVFGGGDGGTAHATPPAASARLLGFLVTLNSPGVATLESYYFLFALARRALLIVILSIFKKMRTFRDP